MVNVLDNPGFEDGYDSWFGQSGQPNYYQIVTATRHSGSRALRTSGNIRTLQGPFTVSPGEGWRLSYWMHARGFQSSPGLRIGLASGTTGSDWIDYNQYPGPLSTGGWQRHSVGITIPAGVTQVWVRIGSQTGSGNVWLDDFNLDRDDLTNSEWGTVSTSLMDPPPGDGVPAPSARGTVSFTLGNPIPDFGVTVSEWGGVNLNLEAPLPPQSVVVWIDGGWAVVEPVFWDGWWVT